MFFNRFYKKKVVAEFHVNIIDNPIILARESALLVNLFFSKAIRAYGVPTHWQKFGSVEDTIKFFLAGLALSLNHFIKFKFRK